LCTFMLLRNVKDHRFPLDYSIQVLPFPLTDKCDAQLGFPMGMVYTSVLEAGLSKIPVFKEFQHLMYSVPEGASKTQQILSIIEQCKVEVGDACHDGYQVVFTLDWVLFVPLALTQGESAAGLPEELRPQMLELLPPLNPAALVGVVMVPSIAPTFPERVGASVPLWRTQAEAEGITGEAAKNAQDIRVSSGITSLPKVLLQLYTHKAK